MNTKSVYDFKYRVTLNYNDYKLLKKYLFQANPIELDLITFNELKEKINNPSKIKYSTKKSLAANKATTARSAKAKEKIQNAMNILRMENKELTHYAIAKMANVSFVTVKKYISSNELNHKRKEITSIYLK